MSRVSGLFVRRQVRCESALVAERGREPALVQQLRQRVVRLRAPAQRLVEARRAHRREHELLEVDVAVGVRAAVEHVEQRHRQDVRVRAADVAVQREVALLGGRLRRRERDAEHGVRPEPPLVGRAVEPAQLVVEETLVERLDPREGIGDLAVDVGDRGPDALAAVAVVAVAQLDGLVAARARAARHRGAPRAPVASTTSTSTVGLPRESRISRAWISTISLTCSLADDPPPGR